GKQREGHEVLYFLFANNRAVRKGNWKLVSARGGPWELYDMDADRTELNDLAQAKPQLAAELAGLWEKWAQEVTAKGARGGAKQGGKRKNKAKPT
ncbi:MAG TPA: arylsulfatase, partial [Phycisphaerae bacterium]|nr:arylsulfatase [Phycisphaerae bacterium]